ncbi:hypothetical protein GP486_002324 [Trichoglossum hirsutum]|uniref:GTP cyclohydrolase II domain-containing protein n=1 Tax=Trichoglossum hirsutum TaxID=265104 RepID=A0A9P8RRT5_9PEZI|nr:hypothetical protein GP486_002324 [Trichoglossum hirsutum]
MSDPSVRLALRVHDECNGSDVFGSDICTCRPYLIFGVEEAVKEAQKGGSGVVIYFRKEGRALGEVTNMKHDAIVEQGIPIHERVPIPDEMIPEDSRVEIDAKIHAGYFTTGKVMTMDELSNVQGRPWEDIDVREAGQYLFFTFYLFFLARLTLHANLCLPSISIKRDIVSDW